MHKNISRSLFLLMLLTIGQESWASSGEFDFENLAPPAPPTAHHAPPLDPQLKIFAQEWCAKQEKESPTDFGVLVTDCDRIQTEARDIVAQIRRPRNGRVLDLNAEYGLFSKEFVQKGFPVVALRGMSEDSATYLEQDISRRLYGIMRCFFESSALLFLDLMNFEQEGTLFATAFSYGWEISPGEEETYFKKLATHLESGARVYLYMPSARIEGAAAHASSFFSKGVIGGEVDLSMRNRGNNTRDILELVILEKK